MSLLRIRALAERHERWLADCKKVEAQRDTLAAEFAATYPALVAQLVDLFQRMDEIDRECARARVQDVGK
jgi:hypothetical protein